MNPGTERAIQLLSESLPSQLRALTKAITTLSETATAKGNLIAAGVKPVVLHLTTDEWTELTSAIASKAIRVKLGDYDNIAKEEGFDLQRWAGDLEALSSKVESQLQFQDVGL